MPTQCAKSKASNHFRSFLLSENERRQIVQLYEAGVYRAEIMRRLRRSRTAVDEVLLRAGFIFEPHPHRPRKHQQAQMLRMNRSGQSFTQIADRYGVTKGVVAGAVRRAKQAEAQS